MPLVSSEVHFYLFSRREKLFGELLRYASSCKIGSSGMRRFACPRDLSGRAGRVRPDQRFAPSDSRRGLPVEECLRLCSRHMNFQSALCILGLGACEGTVAPWGNSGPLRPIRTVGTGRQTRPEAPTPADSMRMSGNPRASRSIGGWEVTPDEGRRHACRKSRHQASPG